jgi:glutathione S-transferase
VGVIPQGLAKSSEQFAFATRALWKSLSFPWRLYERDPKPMVAPAAPRAALPLGKLPVLQDFCIVLAETSVIAE